MLKYIMLAAILWTDITVYAQAPTNQTMSISSDENTVEAEYLKVSKNGLVVERINLIIITDSTKRIAMYRKKYNEETQITSQEIILSDSTYQVKGNNQSSDNDYDLILGINNATLYRDNSIDHFIFGKCAEYRLETKSGVIVYYTNQALSHWVSPINLSYPQIGGIISIKYPDGREIYLNKIKILDTADAGLSQIPPKYMKVIKERL